MLRRRSPLAALASAAGFSLLAAAVIPTAADADALTTRQTTALTTGLTTGPATALITGPASARATFTPGSAGVGDPYFPKAGNGGYDVGHYDLNLRFDPKSRRLSATATITAAATQDLSRFDLDFSGPKIHKVEVNGRKAAYTRKGQELIITPKSGLPSGATFTVEVSYAGKPKAINDEALGLEGWINTKDGAVVLSEPDGARSWFPANDTPRDKATFTFHVTAPVNVTVLANGEPKNPGIVGVRNGYTTVKWEMTQPMATYLAMVAIGKFKVTEGVVNGVPNITAYDPALAKQAKYLHRTTAKAIKWESKVFGAYPFSSTGGIADKLGVAYSLETQGRPVYDGGSEMAGDDLVIVHELAHQWFGDSVGVRSWKDIWLNEGFATYAEWLYEEQHGGSSAQKTFARDYKQKGRFWKVKTGDPGKAELFNGDAIYTRGAMTLHALRKKIGDETFFKLLPAWAEENRHGTVTTQDFVDLAEKLSGQDLDGLFDAWLYHAGKPAL